MSKSKPNRYKKKPGGGRYAALALLAVIILAVGGYLVFGPGNRIVRQPMQSQVSPVQKAPLPPLQPNQSQQETASRPESAPEQDGQAYPGMKHPSSAKLEGERLSGTGKLAVIIDDMGASMQEARSLAAIGVPLTFSIIPGLHSYRDVAAFASSNGIETMIHMPMQSKEWPQRRLEPNGLLISMDDASIAAHLEQYIREIPKAVGANNHMGSEFTEHEEQMRVVLQALKGKGLFFIDSVTSPQTVGQRLARELGMKSGRRNVFLDNEQDSTYIKGQLGQAVRLAKKTGASIAICHPHPATIKTLAALLPGLEKQGITLVTASRLVK